MWKSESAISTAPAAERYFGDSRPKGDVGSRGPVSTISPPHHAARPLRS